MHIVKSRQNQSAKTIVLQIDCANQLWNIAKIRKRKKNTKWDKFKMFETNTHAERRAGYDRSFVEMYYFSLVVYSSERLYFAVAESS